MSSEVETIERIIAPLLSPDSMILSYIASLIEENYQESLTSEKALSDLILDSLIENGEADDSSAATELCARIRGALLSDASLISDSPLDSSISEAKVSTIRAPVRISELVSQIHQSSDLDSVGVLVKTSKQSSASSSSKIQNAILDQERELMLKEMKQSQESSHSSLSAPSHSDAWICRVANPFVIYRAGFEELELVLKSMVFDPFPRILLESKLISSSNSSKSAAVINTSIVFAEIASKLGIVSSQLKPKQSDNDEDDSSLEKINKSEEDEVQVAEPNECEMCGRVMPLTRHHMIPKAAHPLYVKLGFSRRWLLHHCTEICRPCHSGVHSLYDDERVLAQRFCTLDKLMQDDSIRAMAKFQSTQKQRTNKINFSHSSKKK